MIRRMMRSGLTGVIVLTMVACTDMPTTSVTSQETDVWVFVTGVMKQGPFLVEIRGQPFHEDQDLFNQRVIKDHTAAVTWSANARFTSNPESAASREARTVLTFNASGSSRDQCRGRVEGGSPRDNAEVTLQATLCDGETPMSNVLGRVIALDGSADPRFRTLIQQATDDLYSRRSERGTRARGFEL